MEIQRATNLGQLHVTLGIAPDSRVAFKMTDAGVIIWDLETETQFIIAFGATSPTAVPFQLSQQIKAIIEAQDDQLKKRWSESWRDGWSEERETIFTELTFRGISVLGLG